MAEIVQFAVNSQSSLYGTASSAKLTCISCRLLFVTTKEQRDHYKTDIHRFNLKRKVANLPPVNEEIYKQKVQSLAPEVPGSSIECTVCNKHYSSSNTFTQHMNSKKHQDLSQKATLQNSVVADPNSKPILNETSPQPALTLDVKESTKPAQVDQDESNPQSVAELTEEQIIEERIKNARLIPKEECLFCSKNNNDFQSNLQHMAHDHGFFIPDIEYLKDLEGIIKYLIEKVAVGNVCLYCNGKGKQFYSLEAVQAHMRSLNHCKLLYEGNEEEYEDFYDFSSDYEDLPTEETPEGSLENIVKSSVTVSENGCDLIFNDGKTVGHRSLAIYYRQRYKTPDHRDSVVINSVMAQYRALGWKGKQHPTAYSDLDRQALHKKSYDSMKVGIKQNKLQFTFRSDCPF